VDKKFLSEGEFLLRQIKNKKQEKQHKMQAHEIQMIIKIIY